MLRNNQLTQLLAALVWIFFYSEFEWWGQKYKPSEEVRIDDRMVSKQLLTRYSDSTKDPISLWHC
jgi:hypothetical protein